MGTAYAAASPSLHAIGTARPWALTVGALPAPPLSPRSCTPCAPADSPPYYVPRFATTGTTSNLRPLFFNTTICQPSPATPSTGAIGGIPVPRSRIRGQLCMVSTPGSTPYPWQSLHVAGTAANRHPAPTS